MDTLEQKISQRTAKIAVLGGGYVGLPLAIEFGKAGFSVTVFDIDESKVQNIKSGISYIPDAPTEDVQALVSIGTLTAYSTFEKLDDMDAVIICVPTPLKKRRTLIFSTLLRHANQLQHIYTPQCSLA